MKKILNQIKKITENQSLKEAAFFSFKAVIFALSVVLLVILLTNVFYQKKPLLRQGYKPEIVEAKIEEVAGGKTSTVVAPKIVDINELIAKADLAKGEKVFKKCAACHTVEKGAPNKIGPNLFAIVGKNKASMVGFKYSDNLKAKGGKWTVEDLNLWLTKPKDFVPNTKMTFPGLKKDTERADVIGYLKNLK